MKHILILLFALVGWNLTAQTLTINAHTAEVSSSQRNDLYPLEALYFTYNSASGVFTASRIDNRNSVFTSDVTNVVSAGDADAAAKIATITGTHLKAVKGTVTTLIPKAGVNALYKSSGKVLELQALGASKVPPIWSGHADSLKFTAADSTTALRLAALRKINAPGGDAVPTAAVGAAAGTGSPTATLVGGASAGRITLTTGTSPTTTGVLATITLPVKHPTGCFVTLTAGDADAAAHVARVFVTGTTTTFVLNASGTALSAATEYILNYQVTGY